MEGVIDRPHYHQVQWIGRYDMKTHVKLFAILKEKAGTPELTLELPGSSTVADLLLEMERLHPGLVAGIGKTMVAVNTEYATELQTLKDGDEVALIPPVSGGVSLFDWASPTSRKPGAQMPGERK